jgi:hypothetical protein
MSKIYCELFVMYIILGRKRRHVALIRGQRVDRFARVASSGSVEVVSRAQAVECMHWSDAFDSEAKDRRYYELVEDTIHEEFDYRYFVVRNSNDEICAIQPFFILDLDLLVGAKPRIGRLTNVIRRVWPGFMRARTLMVGCAAGEGHLDGEDELVQRTTARLLASSVVKEARRLKAGLVVLKEFHARYRSTLECFVDRHFTRVPSLPNVMLNIDYSSFEEYMMRALSGGARRKLRLKLKAADQAAVPIQMSVVDDVVPFIEEIYPLYLQTYHRSNLHFEKLTKEYFCGLGRRMRDKNRFFIWRQNGKIVAFGSCLVQGDTMHAEYLGLDYAVAIDLHLYHYTFRDLVSWGIANGYKWFHSSALNYDPKFHLRYRLDPIDLYVRHTSTIANALLSRILPWLEPTRYDNTLKQFANYDELWAPTSSRRTWGTMVSAALSQMTHAISSGQARIWLPLHLVTLATAALLAVHASFDIPHLIFGYLVPVAYVALKFGKASAALAIAASALCAAFFIYEPRFDIRIADSLDVLELVSFSAIALMVSFFLSKRSSPIRAV